MTPPAPPEVNVSQVSLVHCSDSVRTVPSTSTFAPSNSNRMSKPPVRVVAPPPGTMRQPYHHNMARPTISAPIPTMTVQPISTRGEFSNPALQRRPPFFGHSEVPSFRTQDIMQKVRNVRRQVADEETELRRLRELEQETMLLKDRNDQRHEELTRESAVLNKEQRSLRNATLRVQGLTKQLEEMYRRRQNAATAAVVEHRKRQQQQLLNRSLDASRSTPTVVEVLRPRASVEPFQVQKQHVLQNQDFSKSLDFIDASAVEQLDQKYPDEPEYPPEVRRRLEDSPSPPKDPHPSANSKPNPEAMRDANQLYIQGMLKEATSLSLERPTNISFADSLNESKLRSSRTDLVSVRSDSLKATKRRSWAASEGTSMSEADVIHRILEEQRKGRNHFAPMLPPTPQDEQLPTVVEEVEKVPEEKVEATTAEPLPEAPPSPTMDGDDTTTSSIKSDDEVSVSESIVAAPVKTVKGILRKPNEKMNKGRIEFDPFALFLDAALQGELDLVEVNASKIADVSMATDEGITALHNAICAGHYEIVRFLIEHDADVNAQDSDGWTPLHCAASCNNLPMVRQLVEGGGCVLATTLSDMDTPVEKCEESEDGYDGCLRYLLAAHNATGMINGGKVYAAYDYEADYEDELSFQAGDDLVVLAKDDVDKHWWTCKNSEGEMGLVPRTYLALYPALKFRKRLNFVMFDLPLEANNNTNFMKN